MAGCLLVKPRTDSFVIYPRMFEVRGPKAGASLSGRMCTCHGEGRRCRPAPAAVTPLAIDPAMLEVRGRVPPLVGEHTAIDLPAAEGMSPSGLQPA